MQAVKNGEEGFSLIELLVAMTIIAILAVAIVPKLLKNVDKARITRTKQDITAIEQALAMYKLDTAVFPSTAQGLQALITKPTTPPVPNIWNGPYLPKLPKDAWGNLYQYAFPGAHGQEYDLYSYGSSLTAEGNTEIGNWNLDTK